MDALSDDSAGGIGRNSDNSASVHGSVHETTPRPGGWCIRVLM